MGEVPARRDVYSYVEIADSERKLAEFYIKIVNRPGALATVANIFYESNINILAISAPGNESDEEGNVFMVVDYTNSIKPLDSIVEDLKMSRVVKYVVYRRSVLPNAIYASFSYPQVFGGKKIATILDIDQLLNILRSVGNVEELGKALGEYDAKVHGKRLGPENADSLLEVLNIVQARGLGKVSASGDGIVIEPASKDKTFLKLLKGYVEAYVKGITGGKFSVKLVGDVIRIE